MQRCDWCQERTISLIPVVNRGLEGSGEYEFVCGACAEVERFEHIDELLCSPVTYQSLREGRVEVLLAA